MAAAAGNVHKRQTTTTRGLAMSKPGPRTSAPQDRAY